MREDIPAFSVGDVLKAADLNRLADIAQRGDNDVLGENGIGYSNSVFRSHDIGQQPLPMFFVRILFDVPASGYTNPSRTDNAVVQVWSSTYNDFIDGSDTLFVTPGYKLPLKKDDKLWVTLSTTGDRYVPSRQPETELINVSVAGPASVNVSGVTNTVNPTITTSVAHGLAVGDLVKIAGVLGAVGVNANFAVATVPNSTSFTITLPTAPGAYSSGGTAVQLANDATWQTWDSDKLKWVDQQKVWLYNAGTPSAVGQVGGKLIGYFNSRPLFIGVGSGSGGGGSNPNGSSVNILARLNNAISPGSRFYSFTEMKESGGDITVLTGGKTGSNAFDTQNLGVDLSIGQGGSPGTAIVVLTQNLAESPDWMIANRAASVGTSSATGSFSKLASVSCANGYIQGFYTTVVITGATVKEF
jgi:hypothetical protein